MSRYPISRYYAKYSWFYMTKRQYYEEFYEEDSTQQLVETLGHVTAFDNTSADIVAFDIPFETTPRRLVQKLGLPRYCKANKQNADFTEAAYFYRKSFYQSRVVVQFHFIDGELAYCMATFLNLNAANEAKLIGLIKEKYQVSQKNNRAIADAKGNCLLYEKIIHARLIYVRNPGQLVSRFTASEQKQTMTRHKVFEQYDAHWSNLL